MKKSIPYIIFCSFFFSTFTFNLSAQEISGTWVGNYQKRLLVTQPLQLVVELSIYNDSLVTGLSHLYYNENKYEHYRVRGKLYRKDSTIYFKEDSTIAVKLGQFFSNCMGNYSLKLNFTDSTMELRGKWRDNDRTFLHCPSTGVFLAKKLPAKMHKLVPVQDSIRVMEKNAVQPQNHEPPGVSTPPDPLLKREQEIQKLLEYDADEKDSVLISIYDNGEIDGDAVSVYFDGKPILQNKMISDKPLQFYVNLDTSVPTHKLLMVAASLGSIPPCTALMIVKTRRNRYELNLSSSLDKNAVLEFFFRQ